MFTTVQMFEVGETLIKYFLIPTRILQNDCKDITNYSII